jgi:hypothetical protein
LFAGIGKNATFEAPKVPKEMMGNWYDWKMRVAFS